MKFVKTCLTSTSLMLIFGFAGCASMGTHVDCGQVARDHRSGINDTLIAQQNGVSVAEVQSCSATGSSGGPETANNYQDQPRLPNIPMVPAGAISLH